jgi:hypothetical protein
LKDVNAGALALRGDETRRTCAMKKAPKKVAKKGK